MNDSFKQPAERLRLHYLDGLRGLAALYVVLHHAVLEVAGVPGWLSPNWIRATKWVWHVHLAVELFIVLSGYCLMLPVARSGQLKGGWRAFIKRRAWRILPPYYAALFVTLGIILLVPGMNAKHGMRWDEIMPATSPGVLLSHLVLLQDASPAWIYRISYPMWTIAQEWQIYFVFVLLLLPIWRYVGILCAVGFSFLCVAVLRGLPGYSFTYAAPEFLFFFSMGMFAACINFSSPLTWLATLRDKTPWGALLVGFAALALLAVSRHLDATKGRDLFFAVPVTAAAMLCLLVMCTNAACENQSNPLLKFCELGPVVALGTFSYSLYLIHAPILAVFALLLHNGHAPGPLALGCELIFAVPFAAAFAYHFHLIAERPFMLAKPRNGKAV